MAAAFAGPVVGALLVLAFAALLSLRLRGLAWSTDTPCPKFHDLAAWRPRHPRPDAESSGLVAVLPPAGALRLRGRIQHLFQLRWTGIRGWVSCGLAAPFAIDPGQAEQIIGRAASFGLSRGGCVVLACGWSLLADRLRLSGGPVLRVASGGRAAGFVVVGFRLASHALPPVRWWRPCR